MIGKQSHGSEHLPKKYILLRKLVLRIDHFLYSLLLDGESALLTRFSRDLVALDSGLLIFAARLTRDGQTRLRALYSIALNDDLRLFGL